MRRLPLWQLRQVGDIDDDARRFVAAKVGGASKRLMIIIATEQRHSASARHGFAQHGPDFPVYMEPARNLDLKASMQ